MLKRKSMASIATLALVAGVACVALAGPTPAQKCAAAKQKAASKKETAKLGCYSKATQKAIPVDGVCLMKADDTFTTAFAKADLKGPCVGIHDDIESAVDTCVTNVVCNVVNDSDCPPIDLTNGKCQALMLKAAGKKAAAKIGCYSKATTKNIGADQTCLQKATDKFTAAAAKANDPKNAGPCANAVAVESIVDSDCVLNIVGRLKGVTPGCGNTIVEPGETCDDGNTVNGDSCPSNCNIASCTVGATSNQSATVHFTPPSGVQITGLTVLLDYPEGKVSLPGSGGPPQNGAIEARLSMFPSNTGHTTNDQDYELKEIVTASDGITPFPAGVLFKATFDSCQGATPAVAGDYSCTVTDATDDNLNTVTGVTCAVSVP